MKINRIFYIEITNLYIYFILSFTISFTLISCNSNKKSNNSFNKTIKKKNNQLPFLKSNDTLFLFFQNTKCGEWGGDSKSIMVYKEYVNYNIDQIHIDIKEYKMNCDSVKPFEERKATFEKIKIKSKENYLNLIKEAIKELLDLKMETSINGISNSGCFSGVRKTDKTLLLSIYPSPNWSKFDTLFENLKNNK